MSHAVPRWSALPSLMPLLLPQALHNVVSVNPCPVKGEGGVYGLTLSSSGVPEDARAYVCCYACSRNRTGSARLLDLGLDRVLSGLPSALLAFLLAAQVLFPRRFVDYVCLEATRMAADRLVYVAVAAD